MINSRARHNKQEIILSDPNRKQFPCARQSFCQSTSKYSAQQSTLPTLSTSSVELLRRDFAILVRKDSLVVTLSEIQSIPHDLILPGSNYFWHPKPVNCHPSLQTTVQLDRCMVNRCSFPESSLLRSTAAPL